MGYQKIREALSQQYNLGYIEPDIQVYSVDLQGDRTLTLRHTQQARIPLANTVDEVLKHLHFLWKFPVTLEVVDSEGNKTKEYTCPQHSENKQLTE
jgi:spore cortex formation protein SpoVR/YcgB (stage V sporulation)